MALHINLLFLRLDCQIICVGSRWSRNSGWNGIDDS